MMNLVKFVPLLGIALCAAGCDQFTPEQHAAINACEAKHSFRAMVECKLAITDPVVRARVGNNGDLLAVAEAKIRLIADAVDAGRMSKDAGQLAVAEAVSSATTEERSRNNSDAMVWAATKPRYCYGSVSGSYGFASVNSSCF
jgi:hypothetical protein